MNGPFKALHSMNSVRVPLITATVLQSKGGREGGADVSRMLAGCTILDLVCCMRCVCVRVCVCVCNTSLNDSYIIMSFKSNFNFSISPSAPGLSRCNSDRHRSHKREHCCSIAVTDRIKYLCCSTDQLLADSPETVRRREHSYKKYPSMSRYFT